VLLGCVFWACGASASMRRLVKPAPKKPICTQGALCCSCRSTAGAFCSGVLGRPANELGPGCTVISGLSALLASWEHSLSHMHCLTGSSHLAQMQNLRHQSCSWYASLGRSLSLAPQAVLSQTALRGCSVILPPARWPVGLPKHPGSQLRSPVGPAHRGSGCARTLSAPPPEQMCCLPGARIPLGSQHEAPC